MEKTRQIDCHWVQETVSELRSPCLIQLKPEQLSGRESPYSLVWARTEYTERNRK